MAELVGARVALHSLKARPELNGRVGRALSYDAAAGRLGVALDGQPKPLALRVDNVRRAGPAGEQAPEAALRAFAAAAAPGLGGVDAVSTDGGARATVEVAASPLGWMARPFRSGSAAMRHAWLIDVYRTRVDDDARRAAPHGVALPGASAESIGLDFLQFCRLAVARGVAPGAAAGSRVAAAWDWPAFLAAAPAKLAKAFNPELCKAAGQYGAEMGAGAEMRAFGASVYADGADAEAAGAADALLRGTEEACYRDGGRAADGRPRHVLLFDDDAVYAEVGGAAAWRELVGALAARLEAAAAR